MSINIEGYLIKFWQEITLTYALALIVVLSFFVVLLEQMSTSNLTQDAGIMLMNDIVLRMI